MTQIWSVGCFSILAFNLSFATPVLLSVSYGLLLLPLLKSALWLSPNGLLPGESWLNTTIFFFFQFSLSSDQIHVYFDL
uniref:Uncharacterized protein n=1 Tax=Phakopsora pachyrhizi TaxID=170000 RepID=A0A0S1MJ67_PHAPC